MGTRLVYWSVAQLTAQSWQRMSLRRTQPDRERPQVESEPLHVASKGRGRRRCSSSIAAALVAILLVVGYTLWPPARRPRRACT